MNDIGSFCFSEFAREEVGDCPGDRSVRGNDGGAVVFDARPTDHDQEEDGLGLVGG